MITRHYFYLIEGHKQHIHLSGIIRHKSFFAKPDKAIQKAINHFKETTKEQQSNLVSFNKI